MDSAFLILVALPLGVYVVALLLNTRDLGDETTQEDASHPAQTSAEAHDTVATHAELSLPANPETMVKVPSTKAEQASATLPTATETIQDQPISSEAVLSHEVTSPASESIVAKTESALEATETTTPESPESEPAATGLDTVETQPVSSAVDSTVVAESEASAVAPTQTVSEESVAVEALTTESALESNTAETAAETASQPMVAEELQPEAAVATSPMLSEPESLEPDEDDPILPEGPIILPDKGSPKYVFDYRGRLWVEKKNKGFFRQLRRPNLPPEDPSNNSQR